MKRRDIIINVFFVVFGTAKLISNFLTADADSGDDLLLGK